MASPAKNKLSASALLSSTSPLIPCRPNPKARNTEVGDQMRRSFRGSPFGDKENNNNEKEQFSSVAKSPLLTPKGAKNFMSPTISAVSKINPSPRKKVLSDRNEGSRSSDKSHQVRSSVSFSDVVSIVGEDTDHEQIGVDEKIQLEEKSHDITIIDVKEAEETRRCLESDETYHENNSNGNFDPSFRISPRPSVMYTSPVLLSHEVVDSLVPPYDPKKNYLSPRPQFLHYRPNPRIELHLDECKQLEELFMSETSSDTESSAEESRSENCEEQEEEEDVNLEDEAAAELVVMGDVEVAESDEEGEMVCESNEETHQISKHSGFRTFKWLGWLLSVGMVYLLLVSSATIAVPNQLSIVKDLPFHEFHISPEITKSAKDCFEQLSEKLGMWAQSSLVYIDRLVSSLGEEEEYGPLVFHNLTDILEDGRLSDAVFQPSNAVSQPSSAVISVARLDNQDYSSLELNMEEGNSGQSLPQEPESSDFDEEVNSDLVYESSEVDKQIEIKMDTELNEESGSQETDENNREEAESDATYVDQHNVESSTISGDHIREEAEVSYSETGTEEGFVEIAVNNLEFSPESNDAEHEDAAIYIDQHDVESSTISGDHIQEETEVSYSETGSEEGFVEIAGNNLEFSHEDGAIYIDQHDTESSTINGHIQEETELSSSDTGSEEGLGEVAGLSAEITDAEYEDLNSGSSSKVDKDLEEVGLGGAGSELSDQKKVIVLSSTVLVLVAAAALLLAKKVKPVAVQEAPALAACNPTIPSTQELNIGQVPVENLIKEKLSSLKFQEEEVNDRIIKACSSEMSISYHKNNSFHSGNRDDDPKEEYQSGDSMKSNNSNESMASSASEYSIGGSVSYGSFTTYEKISKRSGHKEKEMITPVRRSSRIKNHQHSGQ